MVFVVLAERCARIILRGGNNHRKMTESRRGAHQQTPCDSLAEQSDPASASSPVRYEWTSDLWAWAPDRERWAPDHGAAPGPLLVEMSTSGLAENDRFGFWREFAYYGFDVDTMPDPAGFDARGYTVFGPTARFTAYRSSGVSGGRGHRHVKADSDETIDLGLVLSGERRGDNEADERHIVGAGQFFVVDAARPYAFDWRDHDGLHLSLQRQQLDGTRLSGTEIMGLLNTSPLAETLRNQLSLLARTLPKLPAPSRAFALGQTVDLIAHIVGTGTRQDNPGGHAALFAAAMAHIRQNLCDPNLGPQSVSLAVNCSRSTLYRVFRERELAVEPVIREERLRRIMQLITIDAGQTPVARLALRCGFADPSNFHRAFRARFGISPGEAVERVRQR